jgi:hypothetical protein
MMDSRLIWRAALLLVSGCNPETTFEACFDDQGLAMRLNTGSNQVFTGDLPCEIGRVSDGLQR